MGTGTAVNTGDLITAAKINLKQETGVGLANLSVLDQSGAGAQALAFVVSEDLTADRNLTIIVNDAARTIDLGGALTLAGAFTTSGAFGCTLTLSALTNVTLPTTGTLATLAGSENLTNKTITAAVLSGTFTGTPTLSGATITLTGGTLALTGGAAYTFGTTDAFALNIRTNGVNKLALTTTLGQFTVFQTTANITLAFSDPAAARTITFADPGASDSVVYLAATQTLTGKTVSAGTLSGTTTITGATVNMTAGAGVTTGTTDAFALTIRTNSVDKFIFTTTLGQFTVKQTTGDYTLSFADPAAGRTITIADPGGAATLAYINQAQTISAAHTFSGGPVFSRAGVAGTFTNSSDAASVQVAILQGDRATITADDEAYVSLQLSDSGGTQDEQVRLAWRASTVTAGATQDGLFVLSVLLDNALVEMQRWGVPSGGTTLATVVINESGSANVDFRVESDSFDNFIFMDSSANSLSIGTTDGTGTTTTLTVSRNANLPLRVLQNGDAASVQVLRLDGDRATMANADAAYISMMLSDDGGTQDEVARITWTATAVAAGAGFVGDMVLSASIAGTLTTFVTLDGSASQVAFTQTAVPVSSDGAALGTGTLMWSDLFLASAGVINFNNGNMTITHGAGTLIVAGGTLDVRGNLVLNNAGYDIVLAAATATALDITNGTATYLSIDTRVAVDNVVAFTWDIADPTIASAAGTGYNMHRVNAATITLTGGTGVTAMNGVGMEFQAITITSASATTITTASLLFLRPLVAAGAGPAAITNNRMIDTSVAGCFLTAAGVWTDASSREHKYDIRLVTAKAVERALAETQVKTFKKYDRSDGGFTRFGVIAEEAPDALASADRKGVAAGYMAGLALSAVKVYQKRIKDLERSLASMEKRLAAVGA